MSATVTSTNGNQMQQDETITKCKPFKSRQWFLGGPGTMLPRLVESSLSWTLAIGCLSVACWYYHLDRWRLRLGKMSNRILHESSSNAETTPKPTETKKVPMTANCIRREEKHHPLIPLTTHSRREWSTVSDSYEGFRCRYDQLLRILSESKMRFCEYPNEIPNVDTESSKDIESTVDSHDERNEFLVQFIRSNHPARRLVSLLLAEDPIDFAESDSATSVASSGDNSASDNESTIRKAKGKQKEEWWKRLSQEDSRALPLMETLRSMWPRLLELPLLPKESSHQYELSLIVPAYKEDGKALGTKLRASLENITNHSCTSLSTPENESSDPSLEIVIVNVLDILDESAFEDQRHATFAKAVEYQLKPITENSKLPLRILRYSEGGGRGPSLNYGAKHSNGKFLVFLHGDTRLATNGWDAAIQSALYGCNSAVTKRSDSCSQSDDETASDPRTSPTADHRKRTKVITTCCTFAFAIDTSREALQTESPDSRIHRNDIDCQSASHGSNHLYYPPGLKAIEVTANLRTRWFSLPYGDQCLCLPACIFEYLGGYPDQCLMEDYELIRLLRARCSYFPNEEIKILSDHQAVCSPRRWQKHGVLYVTYTNSHCVQRYNKGILTPDELFCEYYGTKRGPDRKHGDKSPWELESGDCR